MDTNKIKFYILSAGFFVIACLAISTSSRAQSPAATPSETGRGNYTITSSVEVGARALDVNGDHEKYRSDLNYKPGVRLFDSSFLIENNSTGPKAFDSMFISGSGWGADPTGAFRFNVEKTKLYKFDSNVRQVRYYNNLRNHAVAYTFPSPVGSEHRFNTLHHFGDFDLTIFPASPKLRFKLGYSFNNTDGPGNYTVRFDGDEYMVNTGWRSNSHDYRAGVEGQLLGFNLGLNYGHRTFRDNTNYVIDSFATGNNPVLPPGSSEINSLNRTFRTRGGTDYIHFNIQRTFAEKLDFSGRFIYAESNMNSLEVDAITGRRGTVRSGQPGTSGDLVPLDAINVPGHAKRPQSRGDVGLTYRVTNNFRISDTLNFDQYGIGGSNLYTERFVATSPTGVARPDILTNNSNGTGTGYRRFTNTIEADYQYKNWLGFNVGYRFSDRRVALWTIVRNNITGVVTADEEEFNNTTHTFLAGAKVKPMKNWSIYADIEAGQSDNVFTRLANGDFVNFRIRSIASLKQFHFNLSFITKDNDVPGTSIPIGTIPATEATAKTKARIFSGSVDWTPMSKFSVSTGYTYNWLTAKTNIITPVGVPVNPSTVFLFGNSEYYMRDNYFFFDVTARPIKRVSMFASYRISDDQGQGSRTITRPGDIISSYPMRFQSPEVRLAIRLTRNIDWNLGYQYYDYKESPTFNPFAFIVITGQPNVPGIWPAQNYTAHLPYTSLRIYFGKAAGDR